MRFPPGGTQRANLRGDRGILTTYVQVTRPIENFHTSPGNGLRDQGRSEALRVAIAGAGKMAGHHAAAITASRIPARVVAVADPSPQARAAIREVVPDVREFTSLEDALREAEPDVVHVCTPPRTHADLAMLAIEAGCHIYVEKPFAPDEDQARRVLDEATARGVSVCPGHQLLFERPAREAWALLPALGDLQHAESYFAFRPVRGRGGQPPVRDEDQLLDVLPHPVYVLLAAFEAAGLPGPSEVDSLTVGNGTVHGLLRRGSLTASLVVTLTGRPVDSFLRLVGTNGSLHADFVRGIVIRQIGPGSSGIDKLLGPYSTARQLSLGTTVAMARRVA
ncbi:MAG: Gfo/Idh/MocA family protein, partial [Gemmatimonadota bacterium]